MLSSGFFIICIVFIFLEPDFQKIWTTYAGISLTSLILFIILYLIRKSKFPVPGIDYK